MAEDTAQSEPDGADACRPTMKDRFIKRVVDLAVQALYRSVDMYLPEDQEICLPVLSVSNHFGGFADPLLLMHAANRRPRIIARDKIWKIPVAGWVMKWLGAIPVHKPAEHKGRTSNDEMFASCYTALEDKKMLLIFPEGITRDDPSIAPIKTGAARIALGARAKGTEGLLIVPVGIHYEDKAALRSRVFINAGQPLNLDERIDEYVEPGAEATPENRDAVRKLTDDIEVQMRRVSPNFTDWKEAKALTTAAAITLRARGDDPPSVVSLSERDRFAGLLGRTEESNKRDIVAAVNDYDQDLDALGLTDEQVYEKMGTGSFLWYLVRGLLIALLLLPFAVVGLVINFWPIVLVGAINFLKVAPAVKATLKPVAAILFFGISWGLVVWGVLSRWGWEWAGAMLLLLPIYLGALIVLSERLVLLGRTWKVWRRARNLDSFADQIIERRDAVREAVTAAV